MKSKNHDDIQLLAQELSRQSKFPPAACLPDYVARLLVMPAVPRGSVTRVVMVHADHCRRAQGAACTCEPDMTLQLEGGQQLDVDAAGHASQAVKAS